MGRDYLGLGYRGGGDTRVTGRRVGQPHLCMYWIETQLRVSAGTGCNSSRAQTWLIGVIVRWWVESYPYGGIGLRVCGGARY